MIPLQGFEPVSDSLIHPVGLVTNSLQKRAQLRTPQTHI
jgi:hypothetical protein